MIRGSTIFVEAGLPLARIGDKGLFRDDYHTFEAYCRSKWQSKLRYAYDLINAAKVHTFLLRKLCKSETGP